MGELHLQGNNHFVHIEEVMAGANGNSKIQFIIVEEELVGQNLWGPQGGETQSRAQLIFFDAAGRETGKFKFPSNPPTGGTLDVLIATQEFADLAGAPAPDIIIPPLLTPISGKVCFKNNPDNTVCTVNECLSYGTFTGDTEGAGASAPALPIVGAVSLRRTTDTGQNSDFSLVPPNPHNIANASVTIPVATQVAQGDTLFNDETFLGTAGPALPVIRRGRAPARSSPATRALTRPERRCRYPQPDDKRRGTLTESPPPRTWSA